MNNTPTIYIGFEDGKEKFIACCSIGKDDYSSKTIVEVPAEKVKSLFEQQAKKAGYLVKPWKGEK